jgi:bacillithiol biosynthesis cysteine-adding enzyme BshC
VRPGGDEGRPGPMVEVLPVAYENPLVNDFLYHFERVATFFRYDPRAAASFERRAAYLRGRYRPGHRDAVADVLAAYNRSVGAGQATLDNVEALRRGAAVVIGGQQAGVLTGPLYTVYKAVTVLQLARYLREELGLEAAPVFWVASDDHDFAEIDHVNVLAPRAGRGARGIVKVRLDPPDGAGERPAGLLELDPSPAEGGTLPPGAGGTSPVERLLGALAEATPPPGEFAAFKEAVLEEARAAACEPGMTVAGWFARLMTRLFRGTGLVLVDPMWPGFKALPAHGAGADGAPVPAMAHFVGRVAAVGRALEEQGARLRAAGYTLQVEKDENHSHLMLNVSGRRRPVYWNAGAGKFVVRRSGLTLGPEEFFDLVRSGPESVSPDVMLRPILQDMVLPVIAQVAGPGEIAYLAQCGGVYRLFDMESPVVFPRLNVTIVEPAEARLMRKYGVGLSAVAAPGGLESARAAWLGKARTGAMDGAGLARLFDDAQRRIGEVYADLRVALTGAGGASGGLDVLLNANERRVRGQVNWLRGRAELAHRQAHELAMEHFDRLELALRPRGDWQERLYNIHPLLFKYGPDLCLRLCDEPLLGTAPFDFGHRFVRF